MKTVRYLILFLVGCVSIGGYAQKGYNFEIPSQYLSESDYGKLYKDYSMRIEWRSRLCQGLSKEVKSIKTADNYWEFDSQGRLVEESRFEENFSLSSIFYTYAYDKGKGLTQCETKGSQFYKTVSYYNDNGYLTEYYRGFSDQLSVKYEYMSDNRISYSFRIGEVDSFFYATDGSLYTKGYAAAFDDSLGQWKLNELTYQSTKYYDKHGNLIKSEWADGYVSTSSFSYEYHPNGRVKKCVGEYGEELYDIYGHFLGGPFSQDKYDEKGNIIQYGNEKHIYKRGVRQSVEVYNNGEKVQVLKCDKYGNLLENSSGQTFEYTYFK